MDFNHEENEIGIVQDNKPVTCPECDHGLTKRAKLSRHIQVSSRRRVSKVSALHVAHLGLNDGA